MMKPILALFIFVYLTEAILEEELDANMEFFEYELEDQCMAKDDALFKFYNGTDSDLSKYAVAEEKIRQNMQFIRNLSRDNDLNSIQIPKLKRQLEMISSAGPYAFPQDTFKQYSDFAVTAMKNKMSIVNNLTRLQQEDVLMKEKDAEKVGKVWIDWATNLEKLQSKFREQINLLKEESEQNGFETVEKYWLHRGEITLIDFKQQIQLWLSIAPLYGLLRNFLAKAIVGKFGKSVFYNTKLIPAHVLGSFDSTDWVKAAASLGAFQGSRTYENVEENLKKLSGLDIYQIADATTAELKLHHLPSIFFKRSQFQANSSTCTHHVDTYCKTIKDYSPKVINCDGETQTFSSLLEANEEVMRIKHLQIAGKHDDSGGVYTGYLFKNGITDSVLYEATATASSLLAIHPQTLQRRGLLTKETSDVNITSLLLTALHIIPRMPYYLLTDHWRVDLLDPPKIVTTESSPTTYGEEEGKEPQVTPPNEGDTDKQKRDERSVEEKGTEEEEDSSKTESIEEPTPTEETEEEKKRNMKMNIKEKWSKFKALQGVGSPDAKHYTDYLNDNKVLWNEPYVCKFVGTILMFQILEHFKEGNTTENTNTLRTLLEKGESEPWEKVVEDVFNITKLDAEPMLRFFKPLEAILKSTTPFSTTSDSSSSDIWRLLLSDNTPEVHDEEVSEPKSKEIKENYNVLIGIGVIGVLVMIIIVVVVMRSRRNKKKMALKRRRKYLSDKEAEIL